MDIPKLKPGIALVLVGPEGCGKSRLARLIAEQHGNYAEVMVQQLESGRELNYLMVQRYAALIVEGLPKTDGQKTNVKHLITSTRRKVSTCSGVKIVRTPRLIFCTGYADAIPPLEGDRRFWVIDMAAST